MAGILRSVEKCFSISAYIKFCCKIIGSVIAGGNIKSIGAAGFRGGINVFSGWRCGVAFSENGILSRLTADCRALSFRRYEIYCK